MHAWSEGNISMHTDSDRFLITPSEKSLRDLRAQDFILVDSNGQAVRGVIDSNRKPSIETRLHLKIYEARNDVASVIHSHPIHVIIYSYLDKPLPFLELLGKTRSIPIIPYYPPGSYKLANEVAKQIRFNDAVILKKHGLVTVGKTINDAYELIEALEKNAHIRISVQQLFGSSKDSV